MKKNNKNYTLIDKKVIKLESGDVLTIYTYMPKV